MEAGIDWGLLSLLLKHDKHPPFSWRSLGKTLLVFLAGMLLIPTDTEEQKLSNTLWAVLLHYVHSKENFLKTYIFFRAVLCYSKNECHVRIFPIYFWLPTSTAPLTVSIPTGWHICCNEWTYIGTSLSPEVLVYFISVHSWCCTLNVLCQMCSDMYLPL